MRRIASQAASGVLALAGASGSGRRRVMPEAYLRLEQSQVAACRHELLAAFRTGFCFAGLAMAACRAGAAQGLGVGLSRKVPEEIMAPALQAPGQRIGVLLEPEDALVHQQLVAR